MSAQGTSLAVGNTRGVSTTKLNQDMLKYKKMEIEKTPRGCRKSDLEKQIHERWGETDKVWNGS